jgi:TPP-dependent pyruvate/acetoin dehydrogenase alpha subunit
MPVVTHETDTIPDNAALTQMYRVMLLITAAGVRARDEVVAGRLQAAFYPVRGLEGVCAALGAALRRSDKLVSTYRNLGDALAKGTPLPLIISELNGRVNGTSKGKGGPMHLHDQESGFITSTGIVGSGLPIAAGLALAEHLKGEGNAVAVTFGDGATSIGSFHEAMNFAALWRLPLVFVCQNNQWAEHTPIAEYTANPDLASRGPAYGMRSVAVDGFDPIATWQVLNDALDSARRGEGPTFVECKTYRLTGHSGSSDYSYMPKEELAAATERDAAPNFRTWLQQGAIATEAELAQLEAEVDALVTDAFEIAAGCASPQPDELFDDIFADRKSIPVY